MNLLGRISRSNGTSRQVQASAATYRAAETLIQQQVGADETLLFVWSATFGASGRRVPTGAARPRHPGGGTAQPYAGLSTSSGRYL